MTEAVKPEILPLTHAPRIVRPTVVNTDFIVLCEAENAIHLKRHWDEPTNRTIICTCEPVCGSSRIDWFAPGLLWYAPQMWEQVILHFAEVAWIHLLAECRKAGEPLKGVWGQWKRASMAKNAGTIIKIMKKSGCTHVPVDLGYALQRRLGISADFFPAVASAPGLAEVKEADQVAGSVKPRSAKPRVSKGCGPCHKRAKKESS